MLVVLVVESNRSQLRPGLTSALVRFHPDLTGPPTGVDLDLTPSHLARCPQKEGLLNALGHRIHSLSL